MKTENHITKKTPRTDFATNVKLPEKKKSCTENGDHAAIRGTNFFFFRHAVKFCC